MLKPYRIYICLLLIMSILSGAGAYIGCRFFHVKEVTLDAHQWLHEKLKLTAEQERQLIPIEKSFAQRDTDLREKVALANMKLGQAISEDKALTPRVTSILKETQDLHAQLQQLTLEHVFDMASVLSPEQKEKLYNITATALFRGQGK
ncbi:MAG: periplasmic heavy metal sensor [Verrucomicrobiota bacterium]|nr:periplasmic heavy metal sensor [Verrucomicrobiota bacterium]